MYWFLHVESFLFPAWQALAFKLREAGYLEKYKTTPGLLLLSFSSRYYFVTTCRHDVIMLKMRRTDHQKIDGVVIQYCGEEQINVFKQAPGQSKIDRERTALCYI